MIRKTMLLAVAAFLAAVGTPAFAQDQQSSSPEQSDQSLQSAPPQSTAQDIPAAAYVVPAGTRFLVALQEKLSTKEDKAGKHFRARTLEPLTSADGSVLAAGAEIQGHIDKVEPAEKTGRARLWLTFDDIQTRGGRKPLVAQLIDAPGVHSIHVVYDHEGEIVAGSSQRKREEEAIAAGAFAGAAPGVVARNAKEAAIGAGIGAVTAFMITSGWGQELTVEKDTKLELVLARPLPLRRN
ncbi:MAG TPA: hypothetical protein VEX69_10210 [Candidatus Limnocylindria bacterium]|nr:hypothetical protein [Candidatus Limnocylindria bacterium]